MAVSFFFLQDYASELYNASEILSLYISFAQ